MLVEGGMAHFMHGFMSMESQAEAYNETFRNSDKVEQFKLFLAQNPKVGKHFEKKINAKPADDEYFIPMSDDFNEKDAAEKGLPIFSGMYEMHRKSVSSAFFNHWILSELKERNLVGKYFFGPYYHEQDGAKKLRNYKESVDMFQCEVDHWRTEELYPHDDCTGIIENYWTVMHGLLFSRVQKTGMWKSVLCRWSLEIGISNLVRTKYLKSWD